MGRSALIELGMHELKEFEARRAEYCIESMASASVAIAVQ